MTTRPIATQAAPTREALVEERDLLLLSLEDLEREHAAGDLSDADYALLRDRYTARAAQVLRTLEEAASVERSSAAVSTEAAAALAAPSNSAAPPDGTAPPPSTLRRLRRRMLGNAWSAAATGALIIVVVVSAVLLVRGFSTRLPGQTATGSITLSQQQQLRRSLDQAETLESRGDAAGALKLYHQALALDPSQVQALAESGWLEYQAGVQAKNSALLAQGQADEEKAAGVGPSAFAPHLYLGSMLLVEGNPAGAVTQYRLFLADSPPTQIVRTAAPFVDRAFTGAGLTPPALPTG